MQASLFGLKNSNRDFTQKETWGKNQFNSSFPAALACFMHSKAIEPIYLTLNPQLTITHDNISVENLLGGNPQHEQLFFAFESDYSPYRQFVVGNLPRVDLVTQNIETHTCLKALEIKLTALPDNSTCHLTEDKFGCEIVVRPDSIVYLALSIVVLYQNRIEELKNNIGNHFDEIKNWTEASEVLPFLSQMIRCIQFILLENLPHQSPLILQPIWKTVGKSSTLADNCLDMFVWSNFAFTHLFLSSAKTELQAENKMTRQMRAVVWLLKMLIDFCQHKKINYTQIIDELSFNTKNDKAFAANGKVTHPFMDCKELTTPRIQKEEIKHIILGDGHLLLSPERRFDAILSHSAYLF